MGIVANISRDLSNSVSNATKGIASGAQCPLTLVKQADVMDHVSQNAAQGLDIGLKTAPVASELQNLGQAIALGDFSKASFNVGLLGVYTLSLGKATATHLKAAATGAPMALAAAACMPHATQALNNTSESQNGSNTTTGRTMESAASGQSATTQSCSYAPGYSKEDSTNSRSTNAPYNNDNQDEENGGEANEMNPYDAQKFIDSKWETWLLPSLIEFAKVPNLTPSLDEEFTSNGLIRTATGLLEQQINSLGVKNTCNTYVHPQSGVPLVVYTIEPTGGSTKNFMFYGHIDKKPYGEGKDGERGESKEEVSDPKVSPKGESLSGRGTGHDVYSAYAFMLSVKAAQEQGLKMPRMTLVLDCEKMSESKGLQDLLSMAEDQIQKPDAIFSFDSGEFNHYALWLSTKKKEDMQKYLDEGICAAYQEFFQAPHYCYDRADTIQSFKQMEKKYPGTDIISFLKPISDESWVNELLDLEYLKKLMCVLSQIVGTIG